MRTVVPVETHRLPVHAADHLGQRGLADLSGPGKKHHLLRQILMDRAFKISLSLFRHGSSPTFVNAMNMTHRSYLSIQMCPYVCFSSLSARLTNLQSTSSRCRRQVMPSRSIGGSVAGSDAIRPPNACSKRIMITIMIANKSLPIFDWALPGFPCIFLLVFSGQHHVVVFSLAPWGRGSG